VSFASSYGDHSTLVENGDGTFTHSHLDGGPMTYYVSAPQFLGDVPHADMEEMRAFAARWRDEHRGK
jgi:hypothetical protein